MPAAGRSPHSLARGSVGGGVCVCGGGCSEPQRGACNAGEPTTASREESGSEPGSPKGAAWREGVSTRTPPSALKGKYQAPTRTWKVRFGSWSLPFVWDPESSQRSHPAFGTGKFRLSGRARGLPTRSLRQLPPGRSLEMPRSPPAPSCQRPAGCLGRGALRRIGQPRDPRGARARVVDGGEGWGGERAAHR